jgi:hypothetical protein
VRARRRALAWFVIIFVGATGVLAFAAVSTTINAQPPLPPFNGWVALLSSVPDPAAHQVQLSVLPVVPGAPGRRPAVTYGVSVCGSGPFRGALFAGGDARLADPVAFPPLGADLPNRASLETVRDLRFLSVAAGPTLRLGTVQVMRLDMPSVPRCAVPFSGTNSNQGFSGAAQTITGKLGAPVKRTARAWWRPWAGPRHSQSWPLIGAFPGAGPRELGVFRAVRGVSGDWSRSSRAYFAVDVGSLREKALAEFARPAPSELTALAWREVMPIRPVARVLDTDSLGQWQQYLVVATLWLSIGGSLLAATLYDWLRRPAFVTTAATGFTGAPEPPARSRVPTPGTLALVVIAAVGWLLSGRKRGRVKQGPQR